MDGSVSSGHDVECRDVAGCDGKLFRRETRRLTLAVQKVARVHSCGWSPGLGLGGKLDPLVCSCSTIMVAMNR